MTCLMKKGRSVLFAMGLDLSEMASNAITVAGTEIYVNFARTGMKNALKITAPMNR